VTAAAETFNALVGDLDYPMFIVTAARGEERAGCLVGFATQTSIDPPRFLVCISEKNRTHEVACGADVLAVHLVPREAEELAEHFGGVSGHDEDKFANRDWRPGPEGAPILAECENWFCGRVLERLPAGDHTAFLLEPTEGRQGAGQQFSFHRAKRIDPGRDA
jgi:flavin reductase (DIM6/NTAB) family NADH-FMN oxidoreductase RutF